MSLSFPREKADLGPRATRQQRQLIQDLTLLTYKKKRSTWLTRASKYAQDKAKAKMSGKKEGFSSRLDYVKRGECI